MPSPSRLRLIAAPLLKRQDDNNQSLQHITNDFTSCRPLPSLTTVFLYRHGRFTSKILFTKLALHLY